MCAPLGATRQTPEEEDGTGRGTPIIAIGLGSDPLYSTDLAQPVTGRNGDPGVIAVRTAQTGSNGWGVNEEETSYTLDGAQGQAVASSLLNPGKGGRTNDVDALNYVPAPMGVRRLTPTECERLMGWEDDHTRYGASGKEMSDSTRYRMCGNGVVSNVAYWIAARIKGALDD
jgi:site-specific DNA-cytosine methylase